MIDPEKDIANRIISILAADAGLDLIKAFVRGPVPDDDLVPNEKYPFIEVMIASETDRLEYLGNTFDNVYAGTIGINIRQPTGDWFAEESERLIAVPSWDAIGQLVQIIKYRMRLPANRDLAGLSMTDGSVTEIVTLFQLAGPRVFGLGRGARDDNFNNFGEIPFLVGTVIRYPTT